MKFQTFRCSCGYVCITPQKKPNCPDCGKFMALVPDEKGIREINGKIIPVLHRIAFGRAL